MKTSIDGQINDDSLQKFALFLFEKLREEGQYDRPESSTDENTCRVPEMQDAVWVMVYWYWWLKQVSRMAIRTRKE